MLDTVRSFDHKTGYKLTTYLKRHLLNQWAQMLDVKYGREKFDPLNRCIDVYKRQVNIKRGDIAVADPGTADVGFVRQNQRGSHSADRNG